MTSKYEISRQATYHLLLTMHYERIKVTDFPRDNGRNARDVVPFGRDFKVHREHTRRELRGMAKMAARANQREIGRG